MLGLVFIIAGVWTTSSSIVWFEDLVPVKVKSEQGREQPKTHHESTVLVAKQGISAKAVATPPVVILIRLGFASLALWSIGYVFSLAFLA